MQNIIDRKIEYPIYRDRKMCVSNSDMQDRILSYIIEHKQLPPYSAYFSDDTLREWMQWDDRARRTILEGFWFEPEV